MIHVIEEVNNTTVGILSVNMYGPWAFHKLRSKIPRTVVECLKEDVGTRNLGSDYVSLIQNYIILILY